MAMLHFGPADAIPGAIFSVWHNISGYLAANYLSSRVNKEEIPAMQTVKYKSSNGRGRLSKRIGGPFR